MFRNSPKALYICIIRIRNKKNKKHINLELDRRKFMCLPLHEIFMEHNQYTKLSEKLFRTKWYQF